MAEIDLVYWEKAQENVEEAQSEYINGRCDTSASRAYYAFFLAAIYALVGAGIRPTRADQQWGHDFVQAAFNGQLINRRKLYPSALRTTLDQNRTLRQLADYTTDRVTEVRADRALARAEVFLGALRPGGGERR